MLKSLHLHTGYRNIEWILLVWSKKMNTKFSDPSPDLLRHTCELRSAGWIVSPFRHGIRNWNGNHLIVETVRGLLRETRLGYAHAHERSHRFWVGFRSCELSLPELDARRTLGIQLAYGFFSLSGEESGTTHKPVSIRDKYILHIYTDECVDFKRCAERVLVLCGWVYTLIGRALCRHACHIFLYTYYIMLLCMLLCLHLSRSTNWAHRNDDDDDDHCVMVILRCPFIFGFFLVEPKRCSKRQTIQSRSRFCVESSLRSAPLGSFYWYVVGTRVSMLGHNRGVPDARVEAYRGRPLPGRGVPCTHFLYHSWTKQVSNILHTNTSSRVHTFEVYTVV